MHIHHSSVGGVDIWLATDLLRLALPSKLRQSTQSHGQSLFSCHRLFRLLILHLRIAGEFLKSREHGLREFAKRRNALGYKELIELKHAHRVRATALLVRLWKLNVIRKSTLTYAYKLIARGWRTKERKEIEPFDQQGPRGRPARFERPCYCALAEDLISLAMGTEHADNAPSGTRGRSEGSAARQCTR